MASGVWETTWGADWSEVPAVLCEEITRLETVLSTERRQHQQDAMEIANLSEQSIDRTAERDRLRAFCRDVFDNWIGNEIDVCAVKQSAVDHGLLIRSKSGTHRKADWLAEKAQT